jgi:aspartyl-tRNA(Asn)/glutamyl-tRNA(Gln) amidotransferase subunit B
MSASDFEVVIGLEVHAQLATRTKLFCGCSTAFGAEPNSATCPVCLALPGALPVLNAQAIELAIRAGLALGCTIADGSVFARKNYFYPDSPKGYQISQYDRPLCEGGGLQVDGRHLPLTRIHVEEDAGKSRHGDASGSLLDYNRASTPLVEIVSEPALRSAEEAARSFETLRDLLVWLQVNDGNLEEGSLRCDANVSVRRRGTATLGTRCEIKNLNSYRYVRQAIEHEVARQVELIESGGAVQQETRLYDPDRDETRTLRSKEDAHDYRYFPEPDLLPVVLEPGQVERIRRALPELPQAKVTRYVQVLGLPPADAQVLVRQRAVAEFFDACVARYPEPKTLANWVMGELLRAMKERGTQAIPLSPERLVDLLKLVDAGTLNLASAKRVFAELLLADAEPAAIVERLGLSQVSDAGALAEAVDAVLAENPAQVAQVRAGNAKIFGFLVGQAMKKLAGKGNPATVNALLKQRLAQD